MPRRTKAKSLKLSYVVDLSEPPPLRTLALTSKGVLTLIDVVPYTRRDGTPTFLLTWQAPNGERFTSGLRTNLSRVKVPEDEG